jgi:glycosyltransferase involved in cell wall biosynthesis
MHLAFDASIFLRQRNGGISVHMRSLIEALLPAAGFTISLFHPADQRGRLERNPHFRALARAPGLQLVPYHHPWGIGRALRQANVDLVHATYYSPWILLSGIPCVYTVHDLGPERYGWQLRRPSHLLLALVRRLCFLRARGLFFVSEATRQEVLRYLPQRPGRRQLALTPNACSAVTLASKPTAVPGFTSGDSAAASSQPATTVRCLYIGLRQGYKNFNAALKALQQAQVACRPTVLQLAIVGGGPITRSEHLLLQAAAIPWQHHADCPDPLLHTLLHQADLLLHPSLYEGFGITVLEAMAMGCPVLATPIAAVQEVAGNTIWFADDGQPASLAQRLIELVKDPELRRSRVTQARLRAAGFRWQDTAAAAIEAYRAILDRGLPPATQP